MNNLPEKFPEYSIMYKTLSKKIKELKEAKCKKSEFEATQLKIKKYQSELEKIKIMFPDNFFENDK